MTAEKLRYAQRLMAARTRSIPAIRRELSYLPPARSTTTWPRTGRSRTSSGRERRRACVSQHIKVLEISGVRSPPCDEQPDYRDIWETVADDGFRSAEMRPRC